MPGEQNENPIPRIRHLQETLTALEQAQEHFAAAHAAPPIRMPVIKIDPVLDSAKTGFYAARMAAETNIMAYEASNPIDAVDTTLGYALATIAGCIKTLLEHDGSPPDAVANQAGTTGWERTKHLKDCLEAMSNADSNLYDALQAATRAGADAQEVATAANRALAAAIKDVFTLIGDPGDAAALWQTDAANPAGADR